MHFSDPVHLLHHTVPCGWLHLMHNTWKALEAIAGKSQDAKQIVWAPQVFGISAHTCAHALFPAWHTGFGSTFQRSPWHWLNAPPEFALLGSAVRAPALHKLSQFPWIGLTVTAYLGFYFSDQKSRKTWYNPGKLNQRSSLPAAEYSGTSLICMASVHTHKPGRLSSESSTLRFTWRLRFLRLHDTLGNIQCQSSRDVRKATQS